MAGQVKDVSSAMEINNVRAALMIPLGITIICSSFDMLFKIRLDMITFATFNDGMFWVLNTLISYFFPSFLGAALTLWWQLYFGDSWSGVKREKGILLGISSVLYFMLYIVYLLYADTYYVIAFVVLNIIYVCVVLFQCMDERVLKNPDATPGDQVVNSPN